jgi:hypothetical protein
MKTEIKPKMTFELHLTLTEEEARALNAITTYGSGEFLKVFYNELGKTYLKPHENGLRSLFANIKDTLPKDLDKIDKTRKDWDK